MNFNTEYQGIGTLNEKPIHAALKAHFCPDISREVKIGRYFADGVNETGIIEIQSAGWGRLINKLTCFLQVSPVTVVYPFARRVHTLKTNRLHRDYTKLMLELYRIRPFLTHENLTICVAMLEIEKIDKVKKPLNLLDEIYLRRPEDYRQFMPGELDEIFSRQEFIKAARPTDGSILLSNLEFLGLVERCGKRGNNILFRKTCPQLPL
jgi:hypothetical protein